jgi:hypothetical protein
MPPSGGPVRAERPQVISLWPVAAAEDPRGNHAREGCRLGDVEEDEEDALDEGHEVSCCTPRRPRARAIGMLSMFKVRPASEDHDPLAVPSVGERAGWQTQQNGGRPQTHRRAGLGGRVGELEDEQWQDEPETCEPAAETV